MGVSHPQCESRAVGNHAVVVTENGWQLNIATLTFFLFTQPIKWIVPPSPCIYSPINPSTRRRICRMHSSQRFRIDPPLGLWLSPRRPIWQGQEDMRTEDNSIFSRGNIQVRGAALSKRNEETYFDMSGLISPRQRQAEPQGASPGECDRFQCLNLNLTRPYRL